MEKDQIDPIRTQVGRRLAEARELNSFSQADIAARFGINKATVSAWETGRGDPGIFRLRELALLYRVTCDSLLGDGAPSLEASQLAADFDALSQPKRKQLRAVWDAYLGAAPKV